METQGGHQTRPGVKGRGSTGIGNLSFLVLVTALHVI